MSITSIIEDWAGEKIISGKTVGGGSIADSRVIETESGKRYFLKSGSQNDKMFFCEAHGLQELEKSKTIRVPHVFLVTEDFLLIEYIASGRSSNAFFELFGKRFADLHRFKSESFGFYEDNFIGHTAQLNIAAGAQKSDWKTFYYEKRLLYQFKLAEKQGLSSSRLNEGFAKLENRIDQILAGSENDAVLLHGDLWSGNYLTDENEQPVIIDPAVYYGNREVDLAMTKVFGGFDTQFYSAYNEAYPLADGYDYRENIYKLYHILNHLNLFGMGYHSQAVNLLWSYLK